MLAHFLDPKSDNTHSGKLGARLSKTLVFESDSPWCRIFDLMQQKRRAHNCAYMEKSLAAIAE
jgi:hypothetical protein